MGIGYQSVDRKVVDYDMWFLDEGRIGLRGPRTHFHGTNYICFIGAAQTFGRFVAKPFPTQIGSVLNRPFVNLGFSGAGPEFFLRQPVLMEIIRNAEILVIQSMSARSVSFGIFEAGANNGVSTFLRGPRKGQSMLAQSAYDILRREYGEEAFLAQISAVQPKWLSLHRELIDQTKARTCFVWLSQKPIGSNLDFSRSSVGTFPHFVTNEMVEEMQELCDIFVDATFEMMTPQPLVNDRSGEVEEVFDDQRFPDRVNSLRCINNYYATPEMHDFAAGAILKAILMAS